MDNIVVLTGAGISAESGLKTFRDTDGLWEGHRVEDVATPAAWERHPGHVLEFYNQRRAQLKHASPNLAHQSLASLEHKYSVIVITQNVDDLHERAGSTRIIHLHGELLKVRSEIDPDMIYNWQDDLRLGQLASDGHQLRPHIVWFGEEVPLLQQAAMACLAAQACIIIGTSMQVYPAAGLVNYLDPQCPIYYIDPKPHISYELKKSTRLEVIALPATLGVPSLVEQLLNSKF